MTSTIEEAPSVDSPEQAAFRSSVRSFLAANAEPKRELSSWALNFHTDAEAAPRFDKGRAGSGRCSPTARGPHLPEELGGRGGTSWNEGMYREESGHYDASSGFISSTIAMLGPTLIAGAATAAAQVVPRLLSGEDAWCQLFSEPGAGSDLAASGAARCATETNSS